jgi:hypothetical protein
MEKRISPENTTRQIVAGRRTTKKDQTVQGAISFILQQQRAEGVTAADMSIVDGKEHDVDQLMRRIHGSIVQEELITEAEVAGVADKLTGSKDSLAIQIAQALNRYSMVDSADDRGMLLLIAALMMLNVSETDTTNSVVRRLITAGLSQMRKPKNDK